MSQIKQELVIKPDPDSKDTPSGALSDEDIYEDAGDLDFSLAGQSVWLTRIPKPLWEYWSQLDDDEEIQIGTVRVEGDATDTKRVSLRLSGLPESKNIPTDYILKRQNVDQENTSFAVQNSYIFTEKEITGHKNRVDVLFGEARSALYESMKREARKKAHKHKKWEPYVRKTVPSEGNGLMIDYCQCLIHF
jgi:transcription initiation factor TFIIF subunit beta